MTAPRLQFTFDLQEGPEKSGLIGFKVIFTNPFFARCVKLISLDSFPRAKLSEYEYQSHPRYIQFTSTSRMCNKSQIELFMKQIKSVLSQIRIRKAMCKYIGQNCQYTTMLRLLNFSCCVGYKLVSKQSQEYKAGEFVLFYAQQKQQEVVKLQKSIQAYESDIVYYPLIKHIQQYIIPDELVRVVFGEMIDCYCHEIESVGAYRQINVSNMGVCRHGPDYEEKQWMLCLFIEGVVSACNLSQFHADLQHQLNSIPLHVVNVAFLRVMKINKINNYLPYNSNNRMIDANTLLIMDRRMTAKKIYEMTLGDYVLGDEVFSKEQRTVLKLQQNGARFIQYLQHKELEYQNLLVNDDVVLLKCYHRDKKPLIGRIKRFLSKFKSETVQCLFQPKIVLQIFYKNYRHRLEESYSVKFNLENERLMRTNFTVDSQKIILQLSIVKQEIISQFAILPSLNPVSKYLASINKFQGLYTIERNPQCFWQKSLNSIKYSLVNKNIEISVILSQFQNLVDYQQQIVFIVHNDVPPHSKVFTISNQNDINTKQFMEGTSGRKPCRIKKFRTENSLQFKNIMLMYFDVKQTNLRHIDEDIENCLKTYKTQKRINFFIGLESKRFVEQILTRLLSQAHQLVIRLEIKVQQIYLYCEDSNLLPHLQRTICNPKLNSKLETTGLFDRWSLMKMNNLKQFILYYHWKMDTYELPGVDTYIFDYQRRNSSKKRSMVTIPTPQFIDKKYRQFFIDFKEGKIFEVIDPYTIREHQQKKVAKQLRHLIRLIENYFDHLDYFVAYALNQGEQIGKRLCLNIYYTNQDRKDFLIPLQFNLHEKSVTKKESEPIRYVVMKKTYADWFKIVTHKSQLQNLPNCLEK